MAGRHAVALVIANGDLPEGVFVRRIARQAGLVVCADGGARHAKNLGIRPDIILGDLDSVSPAVRRHFRRVPLLRISDQESTDLEKALRFCLASKAGDVVIVGAIGDRTDHSAGALGCFRRFGRRLRMTVIDRGGTLSLLGRDEKLPTVRGERFSLIPLGRCTGVWLRGALYPLSGDTLRPGVREGIGNTATGRSVRVRHSSGFLLFYRLNSRTGDRPRRGKGALRGGGL